MTLEQLEEKIRDYGCICAAEHARWQCRCSPEMKSDIYLADIMREIDYLMQEAAEQ